jgi:hypothetical protein
MRRLRRRLDRDQFFRNPGVTISHHRALRREILMTVMGAPHDEVQMLPKRNSDRGDIMPANISMRLGAGSILFLVLALLLLAESPAFSQTVRYELFPEPDVRQTATNRTASAYVVDKKVNQFWICTTRYDFRDLTANNVDCVKLPLDIGRPSLTENYHAQAVTGSTQVNAYLPVIWFIEPAIGAVQFCAVRHAGACVGLTLP